MNDFEQYTKNDIDILLASIKNMSSNIPKSIPLFGAENKNFDLFDKKYLIDYKFSYYRGRIEANRFNILIRFIQHPGHLVRLDVNSGNNHYNPDGSKVGKTHIHFYHSAPEAGINHDKIASPLPKEFANCIDDLTSALETFMDTYVVQEN